MLKKTICGVGSGVLGCGQDFFRSFLESGFLRVFVVFGFLTLPVSVSRGFWDRFHRWDIVERPFAMRWVFCRLVKAFCAAVRSPTFSFPTCFGFLWFCRRVWGLSSLDSCKRISMRASKGHVRKDCYRSPPANDHPRMMRGVYGTSTMKRTEAARVKLICNARHLPTVWFGAYSPKSCRHMRCREWRHTWKRNISANALCEAEAKKSRNGWRWGTWMDAGRWQCPSYNRSSHLVVNLQQMSLELCIS